MNSILTRTLTGVIYIAVITAGVLYNSYTFACLFSLITVLCLWEFYGLIKIRKQIRINSWYNCLGGLILFVSSYLYVSGNFSQVVFLAYWLYVAIIFISELYGKQEDPISHSAYILLGQCYIALPLALLNKIAFSVGDAGNIQYHPVFILALFVFIWVNDTGAYVVGSLWGKRRLLERISPKKSWEGFVGGLLFTLTASLLFARFEPQIPCYHWIGLSLAIAIFGTWGDLTESLIKRTLAVKDSGNTLPGHGGFLDRFDSLLLAAYALLLYMQLFIQN